MEASTKIANAPAEFGRALARRGEREDLVMIWRGDRIAVTPPTYTGRITRLHRPHGIGRFRVEPFAEGRAHVKRAPRIQIHHARNPGARVGIGRHDFEPGIFARRLIQVMVNNDGMHQRRPLAISIAC